MARSKSRKPAEVSSGSMADIAFLLLIFFLVTTTIANDKGILISLPPKPDPNEPPPVVEKNDKNIYAILANSQDKLLVESEPYEGTMEELTQDIKKFVLNFGQPSAEGVEVYNSLPSSLKSFINSNGRLPDASDDPIEAVVSFKANRGTTYELYINVLDAVYKAYDEIYAERAGLTVEEWLTLDKSKDAQREIYAQAREGIGRNISIAEPN